jgi:hypothetical protein
MALFLATCGFLTFRQQRGDVYMAGTTRLDWRLIVPVFMTTNSLYLVVCITYNFVKRIS